MKINEAGWDRGLRVAVGLGLLSLVFVGPQSSWGWLGMIALLTGLSGFCPLYSLAGLSTSAEPARVSVPARHKEPVR